MLRRHAGKLAAIAIAVLVASVVWRASPAGRRGSVDPP
jgi:hypothetical protein